MDAPHLYHPDWNHPDHHRRADRRPFGSELERERGYEFEPRAGPECCAAPSHIAADSAPDPDPDGVDGKLPDPGAAIYFPPFMTLEPTVTPTPTEAAPTQVSDTPAPTATGTPSPTSTSATGTASPTDTPEGTEPPGGGGGSSTPPPTTTPTDTPSATPTDTPSATPTDTPTGYPSTIDPGLTTATPPPEINVGSTPDNTDPYEDPPSNIGAIQDGTYIVISLQVTVGATPDGNYDLVFYEWNNGGAVFLDWIIIGITNDNTGSHYYEVFNWGQDQSADDNSNISDYSAGGEADDEPIALNDLYDPDGVGSAPSTGILIDVDNAPIAPPPDNYEFVVIISPPDPPPLNDNPAQVDAIQTVEVPIPPTP